jgi:photosystem II stability/assembly factor-like uncharacterized protein
MTDELLEQLRARNPRPEPMPPPIDQVLARIAADKPSVRLRWPRWLGPSLAVAVAVAVAAVVLVATYGGRHAAGPTGTAVGRTPSSDHHRMPALRLRAIPAMRGALERPVLGFGSGGAGVIGWAQFRTPRTVKPAAWLATTTNAGGSWSVTRRGFSLATNPVFVGASDGWAVAVGQDRALRFYVTHDDGHRWAPAASAAAAEPSSGEVSIAGGVVWAVGTGSCAATGCQWVVMRGLASGDRLPSTAGQPLPVTRQNQTTISATSATAAYVTTPARVGSNIYVTHDGGRDWRRTAAGCGDGHTVFGIAATSGNTLWQVCGRGRSYQVTRRTGGGAAQTTWRLPFIPVDGFEPVSADTAWAQSEHGKIYRTTDGGEHWQLVWSPGGPHGGSVPGRSQELSAESANNATLLVSIITGPVSRDRVPRSTNLILYRTTDGGHSWQSSPIRLPHG